MLIAALFGMNELLSLQSSQVKSSQVVKWTATCYHLAMFQSSLHSMITWTLSNVLCYDDALYCLLLDFVKELLFQGVVVEKRYDSR